LRARVLVAALAALFASQSMAQPATHCITDIRGNQICSTRAGQCALDRYRIAWCAPENGTAMKDRYDDVVCGAGVCITDAHTGEIFCASQPGGATSTDPAGKTLCEGGCMPASSAACRRMTQN
jgi:hypothetical protein